MSSRNVRAALLLLLLAAGLGVLAWLLGRGAGPAPRDRNPDSPTPTAGLEPPEPSPIGSVTGRIVVYGTDAPAEAIRVRIEGGDEQLELVTDADGSFLALVPSDRTLTVVIDAPEPFEALRIPDVRVSRGGTETLGTVYLSEPFETRGRVTGPDGSGIAGAVVRVFRPFATDLAPGVLEALGTLGDIRSPVAETKTDDAGNFTLAGPWPGVWRIEAHAEGLVAGSLPRVTIAPDGSGDPLSLALRTGTSLSGTVRDADGRALPGATLTTLYGGRDAEASRRFCPGRARADDEGRFALPPVEGGPVDVVATLDGYPVRVLENVPVDEGGEIAVVLGGPAAMEGRVTGPDGQGVSGALVIAVVDRGGGFVARGTTDGEGRYRLAPLPAGRVRVLLVDSPRFAPWPAGAPNPGAVPAGFGDLAAGETLRKDVELDRGTTVVGAVVDAARGHGIPYARVRAVSPPSMVGWSGGRATIADENGRYVLVGVPQGPHLLLADAEGYFQPGADAEGFEAMFRLSRSAAEPPADSPLLLLRPGMNRRQRNLVLLPAATIAGTVLRPDGRPAAGARVEGTPEHEPNSQMLAGFVRRGTSPVLTDPEGRFRIAGAPAAGRLVLVASAAGLVDGVTSPLAPTPGQEIEGVEIRLREPARITGRVLGADGRPLPGASVAARPEPTGDGRDPAGTPGAFTPLPVKTGADGGFTIAGLSPGPWSLAIRAPGHLLSRREGVVVAEGEAAEAGAIRLEAGLAIAGTVADLEGAPIRGARVEIVPGSDVDAALFAADRVWTDAAGRFSFDALPPGTYGLTVFAPGYAPELREIAAGGQEVAFRLEAGKTIEGRVLLPDGTPAPGIVVTARGADGGTARAVSGPGGEFRFTELHSGDFRIDAAPERPGGPDGVVSGPDVRETTMVGVPAGARDVEIRLKPGLAIAGVVVTAEGTPVAGATVIARGPGPEAFAATDERGAFRLRRLSPGEYTIAANQPREGLTGEAANVAAGSEGVRIVVR